MNSVNIESSKPRNLIILLTLFLLLIAGNTPHIFAHGGEDHGDAKLKVSTTDKGIVSSSARLGDFEITFKTPVFEPDTTTVARLFITKFATNEAFGDAATPTMEIESSGGTVTQVAVEKTDQAGSYNLKIPALPEGSYTVRASLKTAKGSDTATFSNVEVAHPAADAANGSVSSWFGTALFFLFGAIVLGLFAGLFYLAWRMAGEKRIGEETVSA